MSRDAPLSTERLRRWALIVLPAVVTGFVALQDWSASREFESKAPYSQAVAYVTQIDCENHGQYYVRVSINGKATFEAPRPHFPISCSELKPGQQLPIWYSNSDPNYLTFELPGQGASKPIWSMLLVYGFTWLWGAVVVTVVFWAIQKNAERAT